MSMRSSVSGRYWLPLGTRSNYGCPDVGSVVAFNHQAWRVVEVRDIPPEQWRDVDRQMSTPKNPPMVVRLRPMRLDNHPDPVKAKGEDKHYGSLDVGSWRVFTDPEHYPVCVCCAEPMPCRSEEGRKAAEAAVAKMGRYETAGVCPACEEVVTARQKSLTFSENLEVLSGPPVTFHLRDRCRGDAMTYEQRWVAADPNRRRPALTCPGLLTNHNDGTYDCTSSEVCPGPVAQHRIYQICRCPSCHGVPWEWGNGCHPHPAARLNNGEVTS